MLGGMSQTPHSQPARTPDVRWLLALVTVCLGGYLLALSLSGQFIQLFTGMRIEISYGVLLTLQLLFAVAVVVLGFFFAPAPLVRRVIAAAVVVGVVLLVVILQAVRLSSGFGAASVFIGFTFADSFVMLTLALGGGWLFVRQRPGLAFVSLVLVVILALVRWALILNGVDFATNQIVTLVLTVLVVGAIGWSGVLASRMMRRGASSGPQQSAHQQPAQQQYPYGSPAQQQSPYAQQNDRPTERGPVI
jgi:hypothetical protein